MPRNRRTLAFVPPLALALLLLLLVPIARADPPDRDGPAWEVVFEDDFDGTQLDQTKWNYHYPWSRTHNHEAYSRTQNVSVSGGRLVLTAREESFGGMPYTTGVVNTNGKFHTTYGYVEARMKMPRTRGSWPAFWMLQSGWPPEIDIMEFPLSDLSPAHNELYRYWWNYHWGTVADHRSAGEEEWVSSDLSAGFHDYAVEWSPDSLRFYFDGELRGTVTNQGAIGESRGMYMILNFAVGGWPGSPPSWPAQGDTFEIDSVRVWKPRVPRDFIDLGNIVGGGDGRPQATAPFVGIHPATGAFSSDLDTNGVSPSGANPVAVDSPYIDSVFLMLADQSVISTAGARFAFAPGDAASGSWDLIANLVEPDGPQGFLRLGPKGLFTRGIGIHSASGVTFDLDELRRRHGARRVQFASAWVGEGSLQGGGSTTGYMILSDAGGRVLHSEATGPHTDDGRFLEVEITPDAAFLTLATGDAGDGNGMDHGVFCDAFVTPCSVGDPALCPEPADEVLIYSGSSWRYLDTGEAPSSDWRERAFSVAGWQSGVAELGYGDGDEMTQVDYGGDGDAKHVTTYFRRLFTARDVPGVASLSLRLERDDGAAVYLNGEEVLRSNLPPGALTASTFASAAVSDEDENAWVTADVDPCLLVEGTNVLAAEVHQASPTSSDVSFDLALLATRDPDGVSPCGEPFRRGDCNGDGAADGLTDAIFLLGFNFLGGRVPPCRAACDSDGDGDTGGVTDAIYVLSYQFLGGPPPAAPFPECGLGTRPSDAVVGCASAPGDC